MAPDALRLHTFGGLWLSSSTGPVTAASSQRRRLALLALVAASGEAGVSRDRVLAYLWPARDDEHARHSLAQLVYGMRRSFNRALIGGDAEFRLDPESLTSDISEFFQAANDASRLSELYAGKFLDGFHLSDAPEFDQWAERERERTAEIFGNALEMLARNASVMGDHKTAIGAWRRRVALDPFEPGPTIELMKALAASGDRPGAVRQAHIYETLIQSEEGMEGDPEVAALAHHLQHQETLHPIGPRDVALAAVAAALWPHPKIPEALAVGDVTLVGDESGSSGELFSEILAKALEKLPGVNMLSRARIEAILAGLGGSKERAVEVFHGTLWNTKGQVELELYRIDLRTGVTRRAYWVSAADVPALVHAAVATIAKDFGIIPV